ncbi:MAG: zinc ribbon domain-containing protein [Candidatus Aureabacteria bacterium]|nr:zinc ribbon domain-containing protein [Candidatus Auribacterota bacterium]
MPIFEYACDRCRKIFNFLVRDVAARRAPRCPRCGRSGMARRISSFRIGRSEESRMQKLADPSIFSGIDEKDPRSFARWMKKISGEMGEEVPGEVDEMAKRLEARESPEEIEGSAGGDYTKDDSGELYES